MPWPPRNVPPAVWTPATRWSASAPVCIWKRAGHDHHARSADFQIANFDHRAARTEAAAGQFIGRDDAVRFLDAFHHLEDRQVELFLAAHAAQNRVDDAGGTVDVEAHFHHQADDGLDLLLGGSLLHDDKHLFLSLGYHAHALDLAHFVDDALKDAAQRVVGHGPLVGLGDVGENLVLALGFVDGQRGLTLHAADILHYARSLVEQLYHAAIHVVDQLGQFVWRLLR